MTTSRKTRSKLVREIKESITRHETLAQSDDNKSFHNGAIAALANVLLFSHEITSEEWKKILKL